MTKQNNNNIGLMLNQIMDYVFKDKPNPYVLFDALVNFVDLIATEGGPSKWKDTTITLINSNPTGGYEYHDLLSPGVIEVYTETTIHLPVLNTPSGKTVLSINAFSNISKSSPICTGNIEFTEDEFVVTGDGTITLSGTKSIEMQ